MIIQQWIDSEPTLDITHLLSHLKNEVGEEFVLCSVAWFTPGESRSSFQIEGEGSQNDRIQRFANVMENFTGKLTFLLQRKSRVRIYLAIS